MLDAFFPAKIIVDAEPLIGQGDTGAIGRRGHDGSAGITLDGLNAQPEYRQWPPPLSDR